LNVGCTADAGVSLAGFRVIYTNFRQGLSKQDKYLVAVTGASQFYFLFKWNTYIYIKYIKYIILHVACCARSCHGKSAHDRHIRAQVPELQAPVWEPCCSMFTCGSYCRFADVLDRPAKTQFHPQNLEPRLRFKTQSLLRGYVSGAGAGVESSRNRL
jgi:hypothetical protein